MLTKPSRIMERKNKTIVKKERKKERKIERKKERKKERKITVK